MVDYWNMQNFNNPFEMFSQWNNAFMPQPPGPPTPYLQLFQLGTAFREMYDKLQKQGAEAFDQKQFEELMRLCTFNTGNLFTPPLGQNNPWTTALTGMQGMPGMQLPQMPMQVPNFPALGIGREWQEDLIELYRLQQDFLATYQNYLELFSKFATHTSENFKKALTDCDLDKIGFLELCGIWIDCCENEFQEVASSKRYSRIYGELINAYMRVRQKSDAIQNKNSRLANQPTRSDLDAIQKDYNEAKATIQQLTLKVQELESRVAAQTPAPQRTSRKSTRKKEPEE